MSRQREILLVTPSLFDGSGGIARIARTTALACHQVCVERGWRLAAFSLIDSGSHRDARYLPDESEYRGFNGDRLALARVLLSRAFRATHAGTIFCHVNLATLGLLYRPRPFIASRDYVVVAHGVDVWGSLPLRRRLALRLAREVWPVSAFTGRQVREVHGVAPPRIRVIHNCLAPYWLSGAPEQATTRERYVLCVSRLSKADRYKGVDDLIIAFGLAAGRVPGLRLVIVGDGDDASRLRAVAMQGPLADRISFPGAVDDDALRKLYAGCELFALPSGKEGFGLVFLEAMAHGKAVLAARSAAVPEVVVDGETGLLVPFGDVGKLTGALIELIRDPERTRQMGERGQARATERFSYQRYLADLRAAVERMWGGKSGPPRAKAEMRR